LLYLGAKSLARVEAVVLPNNPAEVEFLAETITLP